MVVIGFQLGSGFCLFLAVYFWFIVYFMVEFVFV